MDQSEFRRRIEVYVETDLPDLASMRTTIAIALADRLWPLVGGFQTQRDLARTDLRLLADRMKDRCPEVLAELSTEVTGSEHGWP